MQIFYVSLAIASLYYHSFVILFSSHLKSVLSPTQTVTVHKFVLFKSS